MGEGKRYVHSVNARDGGGEIEDDRERGEEADRLVELVCDHDLHRIAKRSDDAQAKAA